MGEHREIEAPRFDRQDKVYEVVIYDVTDAENTKEVAREQMQGLCLVGDCEDRMCEIVLNENLMNIAAMLSAGSKTKHAVRLSTLIENMKRSDANEQAAEYEDLLTSLLSDSKGGLQ